MADNYQAGGLTFRARDIGAVLWPVGINDGLISAAAPLSGQVTVGTTQVQLPSAVARRFRLAPHPNNSPDGIIVIGPTGVTVSTGFPVGPAGVVIEPDNLNRYFAIANQAGLTLCYLGEP